MKMLKQILLLVEFQLGKLLDDKNFLVLLILANTIGFIFGIYYYWYQLIETPFYLWIFVIDSPLPVLLYAIVCFLICFNKNLPRVLVYLTIVGLIKYGIWTILAVILNFNYFFKINPILYSVIAITHFGMILEGLSLIPRLHIKIKDFFMILSFFILNDFFDYFFGTLPPVPFTYVMVLEFASVIMSISLPVLVISYKKD